MRFKNNLLILGAMGFLTAGCSMQTMAVRTTSDIFKNAYPAFEEEPDTILAEQAIPTNLKILEGLLKSDPENEDLLFLLSKSFCSYAFGFLEDGMEKYPANLWLAELYKKRAKDFYQRGRDYALKILKKNRDFRENIDRDLDSFEKALEDLDEEELPFLFWGAYNWANLVNLSKDSPAEVANLSKVFAMMKRVLEIDERYYYGGAHFFFGGYYGGRPPMLGGNIKKAKEHFDKAVEISQGKFLLSRYLYAIYYAVRIQDKKLFKKQLNKIIQAPDNILPEQNLANNFAKIKAKRALKNIYNYFSINEGEP